MKRRALVMAGIGSTLWHAAPARSQQSRMARVGWLSYGRPLSGTRNIEAFRNGMRDLGYVEGQNLTIIQRASEVNIAQATALATELIAARPDVIVTLSASALALAAQHEAVNIPVIFGFSGDPVVAKLVASFARPGGNMTGLSFLALELVGKRIELLREMMPRMKRLAIIANPLHPGVQAEKNASLAAGQSLGLAVDYIEMPNAAAIDTAFAAVLKARSEAIVVFPDSITTSLADRFATFGATHGIPAISGWSYFAEQGNLMSYGPRFEDSFRRFAIYVDRILKGAKPADLPVELPTTFELVVNSRTAKSLGLTIPQTVLLRTDRVID